MSSKAKKLLIDSLNVGFSNIPKKLFFRASQEQLKETDMITAEYYNPFCVQSIEESQKTNNCDLLGDIADFKTGDEVGSVKYKPFYHI